MKVATTLLFCVSISVMAFSHDVGISLPVPCRGLVFNPWEIQCLCGLYSGKEDQGHGNWLQWLWEPGPLPAATVKQWPLSVCLVLFSCHNNLLFLNDHRTNAHTKRMLQPVSCIQNGSVIHNQRTFGNAKSQKRNDCYTWVCIFVLLPSLPDIPNQS